MTRINDGGPVFPAHTHAETPNGPVHYATEPGMSLRDAAALAAMQAMLTTDVGAAAPKAAVAEQAFQYADAFIAAREAKETDT